MLGKKYTEKEKADIVDLSDKYSSLIIAEKELKVSKSTLYQWRKQLNVLGKRHQLKEEEILTKSMRYKSATEAARKLKTSRERIIRLQKEAGCYHAKKRTYSQKEKRQYVTDSVQYETIIEACRTLKIPHGTLLKWRHEQRLYVSLRPPYFECKYSEMEKKRLAQESLKHENIAKASVLLNTSLSSLRKYCEQYGIPIQKGKKRYSSIVKRKTVSEIKAGRRIIEIAQKKNIPESTMRGWLKLDAEGKL